MAFACRAPVEAGWPRGKGRGRFLEARGGLARGMGAGMGAGMGKI